MSKRIAGVELQDDWRLPYALTKIKGIGWSTARDVLDTLAISDQKRVKDITTQELSQITSTLESIPTEGDLVRMVRQNIQRLITTGTYRGERHRKNLPTRGQRTKSNARTNRGKRRTVGSFKKEQLTKMKQGAPKEKEEK